MAAPARPMRRVASASSCDPTPVPCAAGSTYSEWTQPDGDHRVTPAMAVSPSARRATATITSPGAPSPSTRDHNARAPAVVIAATVAAGSVSA